MSTKNIYLFCGEDTYSSYQKSQFWKKEFEKKYGDYNLHTFEGATATTAEMLSAIESVPFLSEKKFILIRDFLRDGKEESQKIMAEELEKTPDFTVIVFLEQEKPDARTTLYKKLKKISTIQEFPLLMGVELSNWIEKQITQKNAVISRKESNLLAENVGANLWQLSQEIEKLSVYSNGKPISAEAIEKLTSPNLTASIFKLTDAIAQKNPKNAIKILKILLESGEDLIKIIFMIVRHFRILLQVRSCLDQKMNKTAIQAKIKEHPYVIMTAMNQSKNFDYSTLISIYQTLLNIDSDLKKGKIKISTNDNTEMRLAVEKLIIEMSLAPVIPTACNY